MLSNLDLGRQLVGAAAAAAAALVLHEVALAGGVAVEAGAAGCRLAVARARPGAAPALQAHGRPRRHRPPAAAGDRRHHLPRRRPLWHHVRHLIAVVLRRPT